MKTELLYSDKSKCCGCGSCKHICPVSAIILKKDKEGFEYPLIDEKKCINCNRCVDVCPIQKKEKILNNKNNEEIFSYIVKSRELEILKISSSGGFVTEIAKKIVKNNGVVFGALFDENKNIIHQKINNVEGLKKVAGSKYVQSNLKNTFNECKKELCKGTQVLYIGMPCQIEGLKNFLKKDYENLITIDLVCHGVSSPLFWKDYRDFLEKKFNSKIKKINFRDKKFGYKSSGMKIKFSNSYQYWNSPRIDYFLKCFFMNIITRPSCLKCNFKTLNHNSNFTVFDCWNYEKLLNDFNNLGYTNVITNNKKGKDILSSMTNFLEIYPVNLEDILPKNGGMLLKSASAKINREEFWDYYLNNSFEKTMGKFCHISLFDILIEKSKNIFFKLKLMNCLSNIQINKKSKR